MLCLSIWGSDAWDSSAHRVRHQSPPTMEGVMRHQMGISSGGGVSLFALLSNPEATDAGEVSKAATCHISFNTQLSPVMTHCLASMLLRVSAVFTPHRPFFLILGAAASCVCLHSCQMGWTHTHDEFTPLCGYLCVCLVFFTVSLFHAIGTKAEIFDI